MPGIAETLARLSERRGHLPGSVGTSAGGGLVELRGFGTNPGALKAWTYIPAGLAPGAPLVVVLHGCTQTAADYDLGSGWSTLAERHGFALLFPEQQRANNANLCFNWFVGQDIARDRGEAASIRQMINAVVDAHDIDADRCFVTGLSAGGAMAMVMLSTYPEAFAGGAIIAGLPYGTATTMPAAFERMRGGPSFTPTALAELVTSASPHKGAWPCLSVWQGTADRVVDPSNADAIVAQWRTLHALPAEPSVQDGVDGHAHSVWRDPKGAAAIELYEIAGMGHGVPLAAGSPGKPGAHMLSAGISSTEHIAQFWQIVAGVSQQPTTGKVPRMKPRLVKRTAVPENKSDLTHVIESALRTAGLMR